MVIIHEINIMHMRIRILVGHSCQEFYSRTYNGKTFTSLFNAANYLDIMQSSILIISIFRII